MDRPPICKIYKICNKRFNSGKALGGHMRAHLAKRPLPSKQPSPPTTTPSPPQQLSHSPEFSLSTSTLHHHNSSILLIRNINRSVMQMMTTMQSPLPPAPAAEYHPKRLSHSPEFSSSTSTLHHHNSSILPIRNYESHETMKV